MHLLRMREAKSALVPDSRLASGEQAWGQVLLSSQPVRKLRLRCGYLTWRLEQITRLRRLGTLPLPLTPKQTGGVTQLLLCLHFQEWRALALPSRPHPT